MLKLSSKDPLEIAASDGTQEAANKASMKRRAAIRETHLSILLEEGCQEQMRFSLMDYCQGGAINDQHLSIPSEGKPNSHLQLFINYYLVRSRAGAS